MFPLSSTTVAVVPPNGARIPDRANTAVMASEQQTAPAISNGIRVSVAFLHQKSEVMLAFAVFPLVSNGFLIAQLFVGVHRNFCV